jgi:hypothetical protein
MVIFSFELRKPKALILILQDLAIQVSVESMASHGLAERLVKSKPWLIHHVV